MWKTSKEFGIGKAKTKDGKWFVVANYYPAGNMQGTYADNVFGPKDGKIVVPKPEGGAGAATAGAGSGAGDKHPKGWFSAIVCHAVRIFSLLGYFMLSKLKFTLWYPSTQPKHVAQCK